MLRLSVVLTALVSLTACAPATGPAGSAAGIEQPRTNKTLVMLVRYEPTTLAAVELRPAGSSTSSTRRLFNASLDLVDGTAKDQPYLAEALPELNTPSWQVQPEGKMQTSYRLRPNLQWHDGTTLTMHDFAFAWQVYSTPELGQSGSKPFNSIESVAATDDQTLVIIWRRLYPEARALGAGFPALPRHLLEQPLRDLDPEGFIQQPYWTTQYVGVGPYRIDRWELGAFLEAAAFDGHVRGRPKIDRVTVKFIADENTALTNLLAQEADYATGRSLRVEHAAVLKQRWGATDGHVLLTPDTTRFTEFQFRPEFLNPRALLDLNVRRALAHTIDKDALNEGIFGGEAVAKTTDNFVFRYFRTYYIPDIDRALRDVEGAITTYPYDARRAEQLLTEAGYARGRDGIWTGQAGERVSFEAWTDQGVQYERELAILAETWQRAGFEVRQFVNPAAQLRDNQARSSFPAVSTTSAGNLESFTSASIPTLANRWSGGNRGAWSNADYDRIAGTLATTLDGGERIRLVVEMSRLLSEQVPGWVLYYNPSVSAFYPKLKGPDNSANNSDVWNVYEWDLN